MKICEVEAVNEEEKSTYTAEVTDEGTFVTEGGPANSPQENDPLADGVPGTFNGSYWAGFTAASGFQNFTAMTGTKDGAPNGTDNPSTGNWVKSMFSDFDGTSLFPNSWQWVYTTCVEKWVNGADDLGGSFGYIVGKPVPDHAGPDEEAIGRHRLGRVKRRHRWRRAPDRRLGLLARGPPPPEHHRQLTGTRIAATQPGSRRSRVVPGLATWCRFTNIDPAIIRTATPTCPGRAPRALVGRTS